MRNRLPYFDTMTTHVALLAFLSCIGWACMGAAQQPELSPLISQYQQARQAYTAKQFAQSSILFRNVAVLCPGSELAIQCQYYSMMSDWAIEPSEATAQSLGRWIDESQASMQKAAEAGRPFDSRFLDTWIENSQLLCAKWDRQQDRIEEAEKRLRKFLDTRPSALQKGAVAASAWFELGSLMLHNKSNYPEAKECFYKSMACCDHELSDDSKGHAIALIKNQAAFGSALASWQDKKLDEAKEAISKLNPEKLNENLSIQVRVLRSKLASASKDLVSVAIELEPAVQLALAGNPNAAVLYELAIALLEAGNSATSDEILIQIVHRFPQSPISIEARVRLARNAVEQRNWTEAMQMAEQAIQLGCPNELLSHARLALGQAQLESGRPQDALATLELVSLEGPLTFEMQLSIRFNLAESLYQLERWPEAEKHWRWLLEAATQMAAETKQRPDWLPTILLRKAELLALNKEWGQAEEIVLGIRNDFPECNHRCEVDYLLARCLVSRAQFEDARSALELISKRLASTSSELLARANWMAGETYLMQRRYDEARAEYKKVLEVPDQKYWHSAALLQIGQCCEVSQDSKSAHEAYSEIIAHFGDGPFVSLARERMSLLPNSPVAKQTELDSSGTKR